VLSDVNIPEIYSDHDFSGDDTGGFAGGALCEVVNGVPGVSVGVIVTVEESGTTYCIAFDGEL